MSTITTVNSENIFARACKAIKAFFRMEKTEVKDTIGYAVALGGVAAIIVSPTVGPSIIASLILKLSLIGTTYDGVTLLMNNISYKEKRMAVANSMVRNAVVATLLIVGATYLTSSWVMLIIALILVNFIQGT